LEITDNPDYKRRSQHGIVYPKILSKFATVMTTGNDGCDIDGGRDIAYEKIIAECRFWSESSQPIFVPEDIPDIVNWPALSQQCAEWMEDAKRIAVVGYRKVLEDGPDVCDSQSDSEHSDHGEMS
jgi:hypothetical protein